MKNIIKQKGFNIVGDPEEGGFAIVYKAQSNDGRTKRAFKTPIIRSNTSDELRKKIKSDFTNECEKLMSLGSGQNPNPNIIKAYDYKTNQEPYFLEMEYIEGMRFDEYAKKHFMGIDEVFRFINNISGALAYCHAYKDKKGNPHSIIHNDLHSANIRYCSTNEEFILFDFGLSMDHGDTVRTSKRDKGWCEFMPPERCSIECDPESQYRNTPASTAWDVYSLGCLIHLALTGQAPFSINDFTDMQISHMHIDVDTYKPWEKIRELRQKHFCGINPDENYKDDCPEWLIKMVAKCMSRETKDRYQNAQEFKETFEGFRKKQQVPYDEYIKLSKQIQELEKDRNQLQKAYNILERGNMKLRESLKQMLSLYCFVTIVVVIAFASNCYPYMGEENIGNTSIGPTSITISVLAALVVVGVTIYNFVVSKGNNKE